MTDAPRRPKSGDVPRQDRRKDVPLASFERGIRRDRDRARAVRDNPDGSARGFDPTESLEAVEDEP
jgi:hypothetical protein